MQEARAAVRALVGPVGRDDGGTYKQCVARVDAQVDVSENRFTRPTCACVLQKKKQLSRTITKKVRKVIITPSCFKIHTGTPFIHL